MKMATDSNLWLRHPLQLHSSRAYHCKLNSTELCHYQQGYWRFWYEADHRYALPTVAFFMTAIILFAIGSLVAEIPSTSPGLSRRVRQKLLVSARYLSYRGFRSRLLRWNSAPVGVLLLGAAGSIYLFCMVLGPKPYYWPNTHELSFGNSPPIATRSGWLAMGCLPFIFATASKANLVTLITGVSHEKLQVFHRWIAYAFLVLALIHTFPFIVYHIWAGDMTVVWSTQIYYWSGVAALLFQGWLTFASFSAFRNLCYEFFKVAHFFSAIVFMLFLFWHCNFTLTSWDYFIATGAIYVPCFLYSQIRTYVEHGWRLKAAVSVEGNGFTRISIPVDTHWLPGQHVFLRFRQVGIHGLTAHPFTICSLPASNSSQSNDMVFFVRKRGGFTARLHQLASQGLGSAVPILIDGPYGGIEPRRLISHNRLLIIAGGSGAGWALPLIERFVRASLSRAARPVDEKESRDNEPSLCVILATRDDITRIWFEGAVNEALSKYPDTPISKRITVEGFLTHDPSTTAPQTAPSRLVDAKEPAKLEAAASASITPSSTHPANSTSSVDIPRNQSQSYAVFRNHSGRPHLPGIIAEESTRSTLSGAGSLGIYCCGPTTMQHDVRNAAARANLRLLKDANDGADAVYLHVEHFSWA